ncbi:hypothetical protein BX600DRAFT_509570 [Xylariales sp. PMI_506]|nr:hypothetical protein BX600DRAFT_509570 [Xylariales sp. PMI_506]
MGSGSTTVESSRIAHTEKDKPLQSDDEAVKAQNPGYDAQSLFILVFRGHPRDTQSTRRVDFYIVTNDSNTNTTLRLEQQNGTYCVSQTPDLGVPHARAHYLRKFHVATVPASSTGGVKLEEIIGAMPVMINNPGWNVSMRWVEGVVHNLHGSGLIPPDEGTFAIDKAIDAITDAPEDYNG